MIEWNYDMEAAPRDGTEFQSWCIREDLPDHPGFWEPHSRYNEDGVFQFQLWGRIDYDHDGWEWHSQIKPIAWMPLPTPPEKGR